jgi:adenine deaminase
MATRNVSKTFASRGREELNTPVDGHSPGLKMSDDLKAYISAGISTDQECFTLQEALYIIQLGIVHFNHVCNFFCT